jgi:hypothetical protein
MASLILTALFAVTVLFGALVGLIRGLNKAVIRIMTLVLAILLTFVIAGPVTTAIAQNVTIQGQTLGEMILASVGQDDMVAAILDSMPLLRQALLVAPAFVISIVVFPVVFFVLKFITWIVFLFVQKPLRKLIFKDSCDKEVERQKPAGIRVAKRFGGMGVGIVTGVLDGAGKCMSPCSMLLAGFMLGKFPLKQLFSGVRPYALTAIRMLGIPAALGIVLYLLGVRGDYLFWPLVFTSLPLGLNLVVYPESLGYEKEAADNAKLCFVSYVLSLAVLPCIFAFLQYICY